ncbi:MAG: MBL fold metallo-hydrolase [Dehalococcoidia bacterium]|nr:MBL fold metallo-hydrolase [Dehalococcoidia bacterium]
MKIKLLGAHNRESRTERYMCLLIDGVLALDAGGLTSSLSFKAQQKIKGILLTHQHYDHVRDVPAFAMNCYFWKSKANIYCGKAVYEVIAAHLMNDILYPNFMTRPVDDPTVRFTILEPLKPVQVEGYTILPVPLKHSVPTTGFQVTSSDGKAVFYTGDTGPDLKDAWQHISPQVLIIEVTAPDHFADFARRVGHLTPGLLGQELLDFRSVKGYLPHVVAVHNNPGSVGVLEPELMAVARELECDILLAREGMQISL